MCAEWAEVAAAEEQMDAAEAHLAEALAATAAVKAALLEEARRPPRDHLLAGRRDELPPLLQVAARHRRVAPWRRPMLTSLTPSLPSHP